MTLQEALAHSPVVRRPKWAWYTRDEEGRYLTVGRATHVDRLDLTDLFADDWEPVDTRYKV